MSERSITPAQTDALAKLAEIPPAGSEELDSLLGDLRAVANRISLRNEHASGAHIYDTVNRIERLILTLMSEARKQGQRDVLEVEAQATTLDPRVDTQVWSAARSLDEVQAKQPEWLWFTDASIGDIPVAHYSYGRWARKPEQAPYVRADIALGIPAAAPPSSLFDRATLREQIRRHGGVFHGPRVEHLSMEERAFWRFLDEVISTAAALATGGARRG